MANKMLSEIELRAHWLRTKEPVCRVEEGTILSPAARDFLREHHIELCYESRSNGQWEKMTRTPLPISGKKVQYTELDTGASLTEKPEELTHLRGNLLVSKTHPQITFRGRLDSLMAELMEVQIKAVDEGYPAVAAALDQLLEYLRRILAAEVKDVPLGEMTLLGLDSAGVRRVSHRVKEELGIDHPIPDYRMGRLCMALNHLRTQVRETELAAVQAFTDEEGVCFRKDIIEALNRLSSSVYILFCRKLAGYYDRENA